MHISAPFSSEKLFQTLINLYEIIAKMYNRFNSNVGFGFGLDWIGLGLVHIFAN